MRKQVKPNQKLSLALHFDLQEVVVPGPVEELLAHLNKIPAMVPKCAPCCIDGCVSVFGFNLFQC